MNPLSVYGWTLKHEAAWKKLATSNIQPARVIADFGTSLKVALPEIKIAELSGKLAHYTDRIAAPKVGDWVAVRVMDSGDVIAEQVILRQSEIARKVAGNQTEKQIIATNVDIAFVLLAAGNDFNVDRLRRYLYQLSVSGTKTVIVLNKVDTASDITEYISKLKSFDLPVVKSSATEGIGVDEIMAFIEPGKTSVLMGSSGVGKSTLANKLLGREVQKTQAVRESDETGKHTTIHRELFVLPNGGLLIDMPGIRELQLWGTEEDLADTFEDIVALSRQCKYSSCRHGSEDGCAIKQALHDGSLELSRYTAYLKMKSELQQLEKRAQALRKRTNERARRATTRKRNYESRNALRDEMRD